MLLFLSLLLFQSCRAERCRVHQVYAILLYIWQMHSIGWEEYAGGCLILFYYSTTRAAIRRLRRKKMSVITAGCHNTDSAFQSIWHGVSFSVRWQQCFFLKISFRLVIRSVFRDVLFEIHLIWSRNWLFFLLTFGTTGRPLGPGADVSAGAVIYTAG